MTIELVLQGKYNACIDLYLPGRWVLRKNMPPFLFFLLFAQKKETKKRAAKNKSSAVFGRPTHMNTQINCNYTPD
jgi:hypothetical protein